MADLEVAKAEVRKCGIPKQLVDVDFLFSSVQKTFRHMVVGKGSVCLLRSRPEQPDARFFGTFFHDGQQCQIVANFLPVFSASLC